MIFSISSCELGVIRTAIGNERGRSERFKGIERVDLIYRDSFLVSFEIRYNNEVTWQSSPHFAAAIADQLHLPTTGWSNDPIHPRLTCDGFFVEASALMQGELKIEQISFENEVARRQAAIEQKKRVEFKP